MIQAEEGDAEKTSNRDDRVDLVHEIRKRRRAQ
jgi:hypothetical protein